MGGFSFYQFRPFLFKVIHLNQLGENMKKMLVTSIVLLCCVVLSVASRAQNNDVLRKGNLVAIQTMLTQRLAKAACFIGAFSDIETHRGILKESRTLFDANLRMLRNGSAFYMLAAEDDPLAHIRLQAIWAIWNKLKFATTLLEETAQYPGIDVDMIEGYTPSAMALVGELGAHYRSQVQKGSHRFNMVSLTGQLAVLSQRAALEFCLVSMENGANSNRNALARSVQEFDQILDDLQTGNEAFNIMAPPGPDIEGALLSLEQQWKQPKRVLMGIANSGEPKSSDFAIIAQTSEDIMRTSRNIADLYLSHFNTTAQQKVTASQSSPDS